MQDGYFISQSFKWNNGRTFLSPGFLQTELIRFCETFLFVGNCLVPAPVFLQLALQHET